VQIGTRNPGVFQKRGVTVAVPAIRCAVLATSLGSIALAGDLSLETSLHIDRVLVFAVRSGSQAEIQLRNVSGKAITAYSISLLVRYADGTERQTSFTDDLLPVAAVQKLRVAPVSPNATLNPGEIHTKVQPLPPGRDGSAPVYAAGAVKMVVFDDRTARGDAKEIQFISAERRSQSDDAVEVLADLRAARQASNPRKALNERIGRLRSGQPVGGPYSRRANHLELFSRSLTLGGVQALDRMIEILDAQREAYTEHSKLERVE
jgi:hypothetical protein